MFSGFVKIPIKFSRHQLLFGDSRSDVLVACVEVKSAGDAVTVENVDAFGERSPVHNSPAFTHL
jgi:hypothetical protein